MRRRDRRFRIQHQDEEPRLLVLEKDGTDRKGAALWTIVEASSASGAKENKDLRERAEPAEPVPSARVQTVSDGDSDTLRV
jgi:hypothetical protein